MSKKYNFPNAEASWDSHPVDANRGYVAKKLMGKRWKNPKDPNTVLHEPVLDMEVLMYNDTPGEYFDMQGQPVHDDIARMVGFDVEEDRQLASDLAELQDVNNRMRAVKQQARNIVITAGKFRDLRKAGEGQASITSKDGSFIFAGPMPLEMAKEHFAKLEGTDVPS